MGIDKKTLAAARTYTDDTVAGAGAVAGKPCQIQDISAITGGNRVTFLWVDNNNTEHTSTMDVMDGDKGDKGDTGNTGKGVSSLSINSSNHLIVTYTDATTSDAGEVPTVQSDWDQENSSAASFIKNKPTLGTAAAKDFTPNVAPNNHNLVESNAVYNAINTAVSSVYTPRGELTCAELTADLLIAANVGSVYEMSDSGTTSNLFLQGAGKEIAVGQNVGIIQTGVDTYKFNLMGNSFDLHNYQTKVQSATNGNFAGLDANGQTTDSGKKASDFATAQGLENEAATRSAMGAKNLIPYPYYNGDSRDTNGILFTVNSDGSITISGTATADAYFRLTYTTGDIHIALKSGKSYILTASGKADVAMILRDSNTANVASARATDVTYDCTTSGNYDAILAVDNGADYTTPITIYPMLRLATDVNSDYQPYAKTNKELTEDTNAIDPMLNVLGAKNIFDIEKWLTTVGLAYTKNGDTYTTSTGGQSYGTPFIFADKDIDIVISGIITNDTSDNVRVEVLNVNNEVVATIKEDTTYASGKGCKVRLNWSVGGNFTIEKPMIRIATIEDSTYAPYAKTNKELTDNVATANTNIDRIKKGTLDIDAIELTANTPTKVISSYGVYLITFTHGGAAPGGLYLAQVHATDVNGMQVAVIKESTDRTVTFDRSVVNQLTVTASGNGRMRIIKLDASNY